MQIRIVLQEYIQIKFISIVMEVSLIQVVRRLKIIVKVVKCEPFSVITLSNIVMN